MHFGVPITKSEPQSDGSVIVSGLVTSDAVDLDDQIIDLEFSRKGLAEWGSTWGNIRQMHSTNLPPAGVAMAVDTTQSDGVHLTARVVEPGAVKLVNEGVYKAFSVGISRPRIVRDMVAKNGRVNGGVFSEVSLVDFPALPSATFGIVKRSKTEVKKLEKMMTRVGVIKKVDQSVGGGVDRADIPEEDFAGPDRTFPIVTPKDVHDASLLVGHADNPDAVKTKIKAIATRKGPRFVAQLPDSTDDKAADADVTKAGDSDCKTCGGTGKIKDGNVNCPDCVQKDAATDVEKKGGSSKTDGAADDKADGEGTDDDDAKNGGSPSTSDTDDDAKKTVDANYALRRAHDATCAAYSMDVVESVHPIVSEGLAKAIDPELIRSTLDSMSEGDTTPDALMELAKAYGSAQLLTSLPVDVVAEARAELSKAFADAYPSAHPTPGNVTPGQFARPYLSAGRAPATATGQSNVHIPSGTDPISASSFDRPLITTGHEADSPSSSGGAPSASLTAADRLKMASVDQAKNQLTELHDHIMAIHPGICSMHGGEAPAGNASLDTSGSITPVKAAKPKLTKAEKKAKKAKKLVKIEKAKAKKAAKKLEKAATSETVDGAVETADETVIKAAVVHDGEVLIDTAVLTELVKAVTTEDADERFAELQKSYDELKGRVDAYDSEPDPAASPVRAVVATTRAVEKAAQESQADLLEKAARETLSEEITHLERLTKSGDPELRMRAEAQLAKIKDRAAFGEGTDLIK